MPNYATGANVSPYDIRTFQWKPATVNIRGGKRYEAKDIGNQHRVGICTAISLTENARKATGIAYSADFQYLLQKKFVDKDWDEGSSLFSALKVAQSIGLLPVDKFSWVTEKDRELPYHQYIEKLKLVPDSEIERLKHYATPISAYASIPTDRDSLARAIDESSAGVLCRYALGSEWWTSPIEPLRPPRQFISGHAVTDSNYDGNSFRIANSWGREWADNGTAYRLHKTYTPTEAWMVYYNSPPKVIVKQQESREALKGKILDLLQMIITLIQKL
jgi:hypothetical protein